MGSLGSHSGDGQRPPVYLGDALGDDVIRERGELLLQLVEQLHDSDVRAVALPHRGPPSSWQGLPAGARVIIAYARRSSDGPIQCNQPHCRISISNNSLIIGQRAPKGRRAYIHTSYNDRVYRSGMMRAKSARNNADTGAKLFPENSGVL